MSNRATRPTMDDITWWNEPAAKANHKRRFVLHTHIENATPYRTSDLVAIVHAVARAAEKPRQVDTLFFNSGAQPKRNSIPAGRRAYVWLDGQNTTVDDVIARITQIFEIDQGDLRQRTRRLRAMLFKTMKLQLRRRRGKK